MNRKVRIVRISAGLVLVVGLLLSSNGFSHARLLADGSIPPRNNSDSNKVVGPCGPGSVRSETIVTVLQAGETIRVDWEETIDHTGFFGIYFSADGVSGYKDDADEYRLHYQEDGPNSIPTGEASAKYSALITLPSQACDNCTIQFVQDMGASDYYSCADIVLVDSPEAARKATIKSQLAANFDALDEDIDGTLNFSESLNQVADLTIDEFLSLDLDEDNLLQKAEVGLKVDPLPDPNPNNNNGNNNNDGGGSLGWLLFLWLGALKWLRRDNPRIIRKTFPNH